MMSSSVSLGYNEEGRTLPWKEEEEDGRKRSGSKTTHDDNDCHDLEPTSSPSSGTTTRTITTTTNNKVITSLLLHSCCAPCSGAMVEELTSQKRGLQKVTVFFYNPNIHPKREYEIRKNENKRYCVDLGIEFVDCDYDPTNWYERVQGMEFDPERGRRCTECFDMRMERTALYASEHGYDAIATTNATSRWKDAKQVDDSGYRAAQRYQNLVYLTQDWQSDAMTLVRFLRGCPLRFSWTTTTCAPFFCSTCLTWTIDVFILVDPQRKYQISADRRFYKQEYCGCSYSLRDSNDWRKANGIPKIQIGGEHAGIGNRCFTDPTIDSAEESQDVVDEFFAQAQEVAAAGNNRIDRTKTLQVYRDRRKSEALDGTTHGLNNW